MQSVEAKYNQALETLNFYERVITTLRSELTQLRTFKAQVELEERIALLPTDAKERLRQAFPGTDLGGLRQAVRVEQRGVK